jgi:hypothetical protein
MGAYTVYRSGLKIKDIYMEPIKVNDKTHEILMESNRIINQAQSNIRLMLITLGVPDGWAYNSELKQFEAKKTGDCNGSKSAPA